MQIVFFIFGVLTGGVLCFVTLRAKNAAGKAELAALKERFAESEARGAAAEEARIAAAKAAAELERAEQQAERERGLISEAHGRELASLRETHVREMDALRENLQNELELERKAAGERRQAQEDAFSAERAALKKNYALLEQQFRENRQEMEKNWQTKMELLKEEFKTLSGEILKEVKLGEMCDWNFVSERGDTIYGRFYLPPSFDPAKKYPMIVDYYGGTTPTARVLESRYPAHVYAALGYVVYTLQPSGATGFGQEFSARHVNAWGELTADEIIEGTRNLLYSGT